MHETDFWSHLEYRVCDELDGLRHTVARPYWCDGFEPRRYILDGHSPRIVGRAWLGVGPRHQEQWDFTLLLQRSFDSLADIDWTKLLPPPDVTKWLTVDPFRKHLVLEPLAALPES
jgi:hypothetical protein